MPLLYSDQIKHDIRDRNDIITIVDAFYNKVKHDEKIGFFFTKIICVQWDIHLPIIYNFWENILFNTADYHGNPILKHLSLNAKSPINADHFQRWIDLFVETVDAHFEGEKANLIKQRAMSISSVMQIKIHQTKP